MPDKDIIIKLFLFKENETLKFVSIVKIKHILESICLETFWLTAKLQFHLIPKSDKYNNIYI